MFFNTLGEVSREHNSSLIAAWAPGTSPRSTPSTPPVRRRCGVMRVVLLATGARVALHAHAHACTEPDSRRATAVASVAAWDGCYGGAACDAANASAENPRYAPPCCDCNMTEAECTAAGKEWLTDGSCTDICAEGTPVIWGCRSFQHGRGYVCDCSAKYGNEPASKCAEEPGFIQHHWSNECKDKGDGCNALPSAELVALRAAPGPPLPPSQPPQPPSTPPSPSSPPDPPSPAPAPPQRCIPLVRHRRMNPPPVALTPTCARTRT